MADRLLLMLVVLAAPSHGSWCGTSGANYSLNGIQCGGMTKIRTSVKSVEKCATMCCQSPATCDSYLYDTNLPSLGCFVQKGACHEMQLGSNWAGASKFTAPPKPSPPPPTPPPPPPNALRQMVWPSLGCLGKSVPHMTYLLGQCEGALPFPMDRTDIRDQRIQINGTDGINSTTFKVALFDPMTCNTTPSNTSILRATDIGACMNATSYQQSYMWMKAFASLH